MAGGAGSAERPGLPVLGAVTAGSVSLVSLRWPGRCIGTNTCLVSDCLARILGLAVPADEQSGAANHPGDCTGQKCGGEARG